MSMSNVKFFVCKHCGNMVEMVQDSGVPMICCGEAMSEIVANTVDASQEKHVPVVKIEGNKVYVEVGSVPHPMEPEHYITFIYLETSKGAQKKFLKPGEAAKADFLMEGEEAVAVYEYCNLHGLWKTTL